MRTAVATEWRPTVMHFRFKVGSYCFWTSRMPAVELRTPFVDLMSGRAPAPAQLPPLSRSAEVAVIPSLPTADPLWRVALVAGALRYTPHRYRHHVVEIGDRTFGDYIASLPGRPRRDILRKRRRFIDTFGSVDCRTFRLAEEMGHFHRDALTVSERTYQHRLMGLGLPGRDQFLPELVEHAAADRVRGYVLYEHGRPIAYGFCRVVGDTLVSEYTGYDPDHRRHSPGIVLFHELLCSAFAERRFRLFDFGSGTSRHKAQFATRHVPCATIYYFRATPGNLLRVMAHAATLTASDGVASALQALGVKHRIRRLLQSTGTAGDSEEPVEEDS